MGALIRSGIGSGPGKNRVRGPRKAASCLSEVDILPLFTLSVLVEGRDTSVRRVGPSVCCRIYLQAARGAHGACWRSYARRRLSAARWPPRRAQLSGLRAVQGAGIKRQGVPAPRALSASRLIFCTGLSNILHDTLFSVLDGFDSWMRSGATSRARRMRRHRHERR
jgi:hypothetical protein